MVTFMRALAVGLLAAADVLASPKRIVITAPTTPTVKTPFGFARALA